MSTQAPPGPLTTKCLSCKQPRQPRQYLCPPCWLGLSADARRALRKRDNHAGVRLIELTHQIADGIPLNEIEVRP